MTYSATESLILQVFVIKSILYNLDIISLMAGQHIVKMFSRDLPETLTFYSTQLTVKQRVSKTGTRGQLKRNHLPKVVHARALRLQTYMYTHITSNTGVQRK